MGREHEVCRGNAGMGEVKKRAHSSGDLSEWRDQCVNGVGWGERRRPRSEVGGVELGGRGVTERDEGPGAGDQGTDKGAVVRAGFRAVLLKYRLSEYGEGKVEINPIKRRARILSILPRPT